MRLRLLIPLALVTLLVAACQGPPPTVYVLVVTATPGPVAVGPVAASNAESTAEATPPTETPEVTTTPEPTPTVDPFPTPIVNQVQVAEQRFENGRMIWLRPVDQIWVMLHGETNRRGTWRIYDDTFEEGEQERDPSIEPPEGFLQPVRGFGKLWREDLEVREALGWALEPEFGHVTRYEYHERGEVNEDNEFVPEPWGYHILVSMYGETIRFDEETGTWEINPQS